MKASAALLLGVVLGACCVLAAANEPATWAAAHCECSRDRAIVCGADGTSYLNKCWAECSGTTVDHEGACGKLVADVSACDCSKERALVCGADGHTYLNKCWAACVGTDVESEGACQKVADVSACDCSKERALVCGADGHTYLNECWAACVSTDVIHQGPCTRAVENPPCACTKERALVCGADGHTYTNACWAACSGTSTAHEGPCKKSAADEVVSGSCDDSCDKHGLARPVCGSDGNTYPGVCAATCAGVEIEDGGTCKPCPVPRVFAPVCDTNGYTWINEYDLKCAGAEKARDGPCGDLDEAVLAAAEVEGAVTSSECQKACPRVLEPVCGMNDKSYANECRMECDGVELKHQGRCAIRTPAKEAVSGSCDDSCDKHGFAHPVCGSDDKSYSSACAAKCAGVEIAHGDTCRPCPFAPFRAPVCDTNGYTWLNEVMLKCAGAEKARNGPCDDFVEATAEIDEPVTTPAKAAVSGSCDDSCDKHGLAHAVCGSDGKNYSGECAAHCAGVEVVHGDTCKLCPVPLVFAPVCDTNGYTWMNEWALKCAGFEKARDGPCGDLIKAAAEINESVTTPAKEAVSGSCDDSCDKHGYAHAICGSDGKNYPGECAARCASVEVVYPDTCKPCPVPLIFAPVCDTNGYTWTNEWLLKCAGAEKARNGPCGGWIKAAAEIVESVTVV